MPGFPILLPKIKIAPAAQLKLHFLGSISNQTGTGTSAGRSPNAPPCGATASMRHPTAAADLPKPHLAKETAAGAGAGGPAARWVETAAAPAGHRMQESAMGVATSVAKRLPCSGGDEAGRGVGLGLGSRRGRCGVLSGVSKRGNRGGAADAAGS